jgi:hypothetical protein
VTSSGGIEALGRHQRFLLRQVELRGGAAGELRFDQRENALGVGDVAVRDTQFVLGGEDREIGVGDGRDRRQCHHLAIVARNGRVLLGGI